jgi:O-acetyl-ADP-ribose deacetylase (regulator of RNase III)
VIHTVAPVFAQHEEDEVWRLLAGCYRNALGLAVQHAAQSIAFPSLGTGVYGIPIAQASRTAVDATLAHFEAHEAPTRVVFCCFSDGDAAQYRAALAERGLG